MKCVHTPLPSSITIIILGFIITLHATINVRLTITISVTIKVIITTTIVAMAMPLQSVLPPLPSILLSLSLYIQLFSFPGDDTWDSLANNCRNPSQAYSGPWCYTTVNNPSFQYCSSIPSCKGDTYACVFVCMEDIDGSWCGDKLSSRNIKWCKWDLISEPFGGDWDIPSGNIKWCKWDLISEPFGGDWDNFSGNIKWWKWDLISEPFGGDWNIPKIICNQWRWQ